MIILSLGSNLSSTFGDRFDNLNLAVSFLESCGIIIEKKSSFYETPSYPNKKNPKFLNIIISIKSILPLVDLMSVLIYIEEKLERKRDQKNDPRTCDIDIIDYNNQILNSKYRHLDLVVPHKELENRNFVLFPLQEIIPTWKHPKTGEIISTLIQKLPAEDRNSILMIKKN
jgi:2-amino-4-hydroxy-6-hydroxymethyldihydropteridine diphosphokinase